MDVKFNITAANELLSQMNFYCSGIVRETSELLKLMGTSESWNDNQHRAFDNNIKELAQDLNCALALNSEYMRTFQQRINELKG